MNVLSLFDGMSCGRIALERCGFKVENYFASEIDKHAIKVAKANYPDTVHLGDVTGVRTKNQMLVRRHENGNGHQRINLLIGGSPCQGFSFAGGQLAFDDPRSKLFFEYVRLLEELKPRYFLLENVIMKQEFQDIITKMLGVKPVRINSNLVSAQNRDRLYWTNSPVKSLPENKRIYLKDILQSVEDISEEHYHSMKSVAYMERGNDKWGQAGSRRADGYEQTPETEKSFTLTANMHKGVPYNYFKETRQMSFGFDEPETKSGLIMAGQADLKGHDSNRRVYHPNGKAPTLAAASGGNLEPKVTNGLRWRKLTPLECERLQTVPDNYTNHVSNTQRYRMLGNGWTIDVICHLLKGMKANSSTYTSKEKDCECGLKEDGTWGDEVFDRFGCECETLD